MSFNSIKMLKISSFQICPNKFTFNSRNFQIKIPLINRLFSNGDISKAGGSFGKKERAQEEQYFRKKEKEELEAFKSSINKKKDSKKDSKPEKK